MEDLPQQRQQSRPDGDPPPTPMIDQPPSPPQGSTLRSVLPLVIVLALLGWLGWERLQRAQQPPALVVSLADATPPAASFSEKLPATADGGIMSLARGDCHTAAANFRTARRGAPDHARLWVLEGAAFICAGQPDEARDVLDEVAATDAPPRQVWWYLAQACLMQGDTTCAALKLNRAILEDKRHRRQAQGQLRQLQVALDQLQ